MRLKSTWSWRRCAAALDRRCVARRRRSDCDDAVDRREVSRRGRSGSARSSSPSGREGGSVSLRWICARSSSARSSASKRARDATAEPVVARVAGRELGTAARRAGRARGGSAARRARPRPPASRPKRPSAATARRARSRSRVRRTVARAPAASCARSSSRSIWSAPPSPPPRRSAPRRMPRVDRRRLGGAKEEALEHQVEDAPLLLATWRASRRAPRERSRRSRQSISPSAAKRVEELRRCRSRSLPRARSCLAELEQLGVDASRERGGVGVPGAGRADRLSSATSSRSVRCLTITDIVSLNTTASRSWGAEQQRARAPSRSTRRATATS